MSTETATAEAPAHEHAFDLSHLENASFAALQAGRAAIFRTSSTRNGFAKDIEALGPDGDQGRKKGLGLWMLARHEESVKLLAKFEGDDVADYTRARSLISLGRNAEAIPLFERLTKDYPNEPRPRGGLIEARLEAALEGVDELTEPEKGTAVLDAELDGADPGFLQSADGRYLLGRRAELKRDLSEALDHYAAAHELDPTLRNNLLRAAYAAERAGLDDLAIQFYEEALEMRLCNSSHLMNLGVLYEDTGRDQDAAALYDIVSNSNPTDERARLYLADAVSAMDMYYDEDLERKEDKLNQILRIPITDFELSVRARNCLNKMQIHTLGDLVTKTEQELLSYKNFGETSLNEIKEILRSKGLRLGMPREEAVASIEARARRPVAAGSTGATTNDDGDISNRPITDLQLSIRARRTVEALGCLTIGDITKHSADELLGMPNFGSTSLQELRAKLTDMSLKLAGE
ncbi:DNA-directed RNA polymerase subunit alpha C-terminal domain-containing protein [Engelhardtia mirabilis]|uniref:DNA-directed RNA polymerase subunit alpha n=1 Tax=Engelhardtia mirabilis TaxID=2528011 RepID=A0A518BLV8_9BACT|nr:DNA-directed RNA polymerase subunit alpha [Planctomycetes bacterium Pla133]QDV02294.1 DNA-directed RNA polymerase subunit alpha [Planctomycetes bacterium Pla86]